ncbi:hypothetical protein [Ralstonia pseudosolanacearum]|uniref:hypothetical protein n=1 Tax=Ralstonia pseudosolanacearum TaxID=1310165 RepID=UPI003CE6997A
MTSMSYMHEQQERSQFEAFWRSKKYPELGRGPDGKYLDHGQQVAWESWLYSRAIAIPEAFSGAPVQDHLVNDWFLSLCPGRRDALHEDRWRLAGAAMGWGMRIGWVAASISPFMTDTIHSLGRSLKQALSYIEHSEANRGHARTEAEWDAAVENYRRNGPSGIGIGRSYLDKAHVNLVSAREAIERYEEYSKLHRPKLLEAAPAPEGATGRVDVTM